jgi:molybdopterin converting factor small subunit
MPATVTITLSTSLQLIAQTAEPVEIEAETPFRAMIQLVHRHPELRHILLDNNGGLRGRTMQLFLNGVQMDRAHGDMQIILADGDALHLVTPVSGG